MLLLKCKISIFGDVEMIKKRFLWADIAKAFAIVSVLLAHTAWLPAPLSRFVFTFNMPLFFILSGYFMKDVTDIKAATKKDAKALLLPYAVTCVIMIVLASLRAAIFGGDVLAEASKWFFASLYGSGGRIAPWAGDTRHIGAIWFLLALFLAKLIVNSVSKYKYQAVIIAAIAYVGYATRDFTWLPFSIQAGMTASFYLYFGKVFKKYDLFNRTYNEKPWLIYAFSVLTWGFCIKYCGKLYMVNNTYSNGMLDVIGSICATFCIVWVSMLIEKYIPYVNKCLAAMGKITLPILCCHILELNVFPWRWVYDNISENWLVIFALRCVLVAVMVAVIRFVPIVNKVYFPGIKKKKSK